MAEKRDGKRARRTWLSILSAVAIGDLNALRHAGAAVDTWQGIDQTLSTNSTNAWQPTSSGPGAGNEGYVPNLKETGTTIAVLGAGANLNYGALVLDDAVVNGFTATTGELFLDTATAATTSTYTLTLNGDSTDLGNADLIQLTNKVTGEFEIRGNNGTLLLDLATAGNLDVVNSAAILQVNVTIEGTSGFTKTGAGTLLLSASNSFSGGMTINGGDVSVNAGTPLGSSTNNVAINGGSLVFTAGVGLTNSRTFTLGSVSSDIDVAASDLVSVAGAVGGTGTLNVNAFSSSDTGTLELVNGTNGYSGGTVVQHGTFEVGVGASIGAVPVSPGTNVTLYPGTTFQFAGNVVNSPLDPNRGIAIGSPTAGGTASFDVASGNIVVIDGAIADNTGGSGALNKVDTGTLILTGSSTYSGGTSVTAGILNIDGALTSTSNAVTVSNSATLGGVGSIAGAVTVNSGGNIAPGEPDTYNAADANAGPFNAAAKFGTLTVGSAAISGTLQIGLEDSMSPDVDVLDATGALNIGSATVNFNVTGTPAQPAYVFAEYGSLTGTFATVDNLPSGYTINYDYQGNDQIALVAVPEPASGASALLLCAGLVLRRGKRRAAGGNS
jgi:autotransporter-associated beta strand protein